MITIPLWLFIVYGLVAVPILGIVGAYIYWVIQVVIIIIKTFFGYEVEDNK